MAWQPMQHSFTIMGSTPKGGMAASMKALKARFQHQSMTNRIALCAMLLEDLKVTLRFSVNWSVAEQTIAHALAICLSMKKCRIVKMPSSAIVCSLETPKYLSKTGADDFLSWRGGVWWVERDMDRFRFTCWSYRVGGA